MDTRRFPHGDLDWAPKAREIGDVPSRPAGRGGIDRKKNKCYYNKVLNLFKNTRNTFKQRSRNG